MEELIRFTKPITIATGKAVAAGNSGRQEDLIIASNSGRKAVSDLLRACKVSERFIGFKYILFRRRGLGVA